MRATQDVLQLAYSDLTGTIIDAFYTVYNALGDGHFESVYVRALQVELEFRGIPSEREAPLTVRYRDKVVGDFRVDLLVAETIIVEVKTADKISAAHERQTLNSVRFPSFRVSQFLHIAISSIRDAARTFSELAAESIRSPHQKATPWPLHRMIVVAKAPTARGRRRASGRRHRPDRWQE